MNDIFAAGRYWLGITTILMTPACASLTTYNHSESLKSGVAQVTYLDAKQRAVFTVPGGSYINSSQAIRFCAEPSPDALSALSASGSGGLSFAQKASAQAAYSVAESASNIGLRTQSIQLMRDAMYRICEGSASGTLSSIQVETLFRRFQNSMVAILAIEQLTGVVRAANAQLSTTTGVGATKEIASLTEDAAKARDASVDADAKAKAAAKAATDATAKRDAYLKTAGIMEDALSDAQKKEFAPLKTAAADATTANASAIITAANAKERLAIYDTGMKAIGGGNLNASGTAVSTGGSGGPIDAASAVVIANAVQAIVLAQLDLGFFRDACATLFDAEMDGRAISVQADNLKASCNQYAQATITNTTKQMDAYVQVSKVQAEAYAKYAADYGVYLTKLAASGKPGAVAAAPPVFIPQPVQPPPPAMMMAPLVIQSLNPNSGATPPGK